AMLPDGSMTGKTRPEFKAIDAFNVTRVLAGDAAYSRDWLLGDPAAQRPELGPPLHLERGRPRQPRRAQLGTQAGRGLPGQLRVAGGPTGEFSGALLDLLRRQGLPGQAELRGPQA